MAINPSLFHLYNITDTCAVWNVLSSLTLYKTAHSSGVVFCCTNFVIYECLFKPRKAIKPWEELLRSRLKTARKKSDFIDHNLDIVDLQTIEILEKRKQLGKGELSSIAFALKTRQAFLSDDQKARKFAYDVLNELIVQTTPHLLGWLIFTNRLGDSDKNIIISEHQEVKRPLSIYFEEMYQEACRCRLLGSSQKTENIAR